MDLTNRENAPSSVCHQTQETRGYVCLSPHLQKKTTVTSAVSRSCRLNQINMRLLHKETSVSVAIGTRLIIKASGFPKHLCTLHKAVQHNVRHKPTASLSAFISDSAPLQFVPLRSGANNAGRRSHTGISVLQQASAYSR